ncbi:hypothetical protein ACERIT_01285 [Halopenitus sp. H-Gu1]|uniref:DUF7310 family coiled-coil domain-containing protein n=1 Tax=Halopenitus sp. H-Gu1 TaxID=3242697 RepID=UPI00359DED0C
MTERDVDTSTTNAGTDSLTPEDVSTDGHRDGNENRNGGHTTDETPDGRELLEHDRLVDRVDAIERALTGEGDGAVVDLSDRTELDARVNDLDSRVETMAERLDELAAATQAVRGYVGSIRAVNREIESRADLALATAERVERGCEATTGTGTAVESPGFEEPPARSGRRTDGGNGGELGDEHTGEDCSRIEDETTVETERSSGLTGRRNEGRTERRDRTERKSRNKTERNTAIRTPTTPTNASDRTDTSASGRPPAVAAAVPDVGEIDRIPDTSGRDAESSESGVLARLRNVL